MEGTRATQARFRLRITRNDATGSARAEGRAQTEERRGDGGGGYETERRTETQS